MDVFKDAWEREVRILTDAVDDITTIHDFLAVSGELLFNQIKIQKILVFSVNHIFNKIKDVKIFP